MKYFLCLKMSEMQSISEHTGNLFCKFPNEFLFFHCIRSMSYFLCLKKILIFHCHKYSTIFNKFELCVTSLSAFTRFSLFRLEILIGKHLASAHFFAAFCSVAKISPLR